VHDENTVIFKGTTNGINISVEIVRLLKKGMASADVAKRLGVPVSVADELKALL
jgi:outer membrane protein assembly factor BamE (lipoprotein component of BamABCDE complex)